MYDWKKSFLAAGKDLVHSLVGIAAAAAVAYLADPAHYAAFIAAVPMQYAIPAGLAASALAAYFRNWLKWGIFAAKKL